MNHFQPKSFAFYGGAIAFVMSLFGVVTTYGEANLKTAQSIGGEYQLNLPVSAPCSGGKSVLLSVQQSGVYLAAALTNPVLMRNPSAFKSMTLSGQWQNQLLTLEGKVPVGVLCENSKATSPVMVKFEGRIASPQESQPTQTANESTTLQGTLSLNTKTASFKAQRLPVLKGEAK